MSKVILITGCSTGIGRRLAEDLTQAGYTVAATARRLESLDGLDAALKLELDVTRQESINAAVTIVIERFGRIDVLVNNAGYAQCGALEEVPDDLTRQMFDVNVFGVLGMIREVAPIMRRQGSGRIINVSSIAGKMSTPVNGAYSASKFAVEALSDALRWELEPFGVQVVLVEPGAVKTAFDSTVMAHAAAILSNPASPYRRLYQKYQQVSDGMRKGEPGPEVVSRTVQQAIEAQKPRNRYLAGVSLPTRIVLQLRDLVWDFAVRQMFTTGEPARALPGGRRGSIGHAQPLG